MAGGGYACAADATFVGPPDYRGLAHWADPLPELTAMPDDFVGPLGPQQHTAAELEALRGAWDRISHDEGLRLDGDRADRNELRAMLREDLIASPTLRQVVGEIGGDRDPAHEVRGELGHHQFLPAHPDVPVTFDQFDTGQIDLEDLERLPSTPNSPLGPTRAEYLAHMLAERRVAALSDDPRAFAAHHAAAIGAQNGVRTELGQPRVERQELSEGRNILTTLEDNDAVESVTTHQGHVWNVE